MSSWKKSDAFFCKDDRVATATMQCKACRHEFEADVEYPETRPEWVVVTHPESATWKEMLLQCPQCGAHEGHKDMPCLVCEASALASTVEGS